MKLVYLSFTFVLGICLGSQLDDYWGILLTATALLAILLYKRDKKFLVWGTLCCILFVGGFFRAQLLPAGDELQSYRGFFHLKGIIAADPEVKDYGTQLRLEVVALKNDGEWQTVRGTALVNAPTFTVLDEERDFPYYRYGDLLGEDIGIHIVLTFQYAIRRQGEIFGFIVHD